MGADQVAAIGPAIDELEDDERLNAPNAPARHCARFSLASLGCPWVEVYLERDTVVNLWYPFDDAPLAYLQTLGITALPGARVLSIERPACTLAFHRVQSRLLALFVDQLFLEMYACAADYGIDVEMCRFGSPSGRT